MLSIVFFMTFAVFTHALYGMDAPAGNRAVVFRKLSDGLTNEVCAQIRELCEKTTDPFAAFNAVEEKVKKIVGNIEDTALFHRLLPVKPFYDRCEDICKKITDLFAQARPSSFDYHFVLLERNILNRLSGAMRLFIEELYVRKYYMKLKDDGKIEMVRCANKAPKITFLTNTDFLVGYNRLKSAEKQNVIHVYMKDGSLVVKEEEIASVLQHRLPTPETISFEIHSTTVKHNKGKLLRSMHIDWHLPFDALLFEFIKKGSEDEDAENLAAKILTLPEGVKGVSKKIICEQKISHDGEKVFFVLLTSDGVVKFFKGVIEFDKSTEQNIDQIYLHKVPSVLLTSKPDIKILFSHNDRFVFVILDELGWLIDLEGKKTYYPSEVSEFKARAAAFSQDDKTLTLSSRRGDNLFAIEIATHKNIWEETDPDATIRNLKYSPNGQILVLMRADDIVIRSAYMPTLAQLLFERIVTQCCVPVPISSPNPVERSKKILEELRARFQERKALLAPAAEAPPRVVIPLVPHKAEFRLETRFKEGRDARPFTCLAIDGIGTQALYCAYVLQKIAEKSTYPLHKLFDCVVGANFGSILAASVGASADGINPLITPKKLISQLKSRALEIFPPKEKKSYKPFYDSAGLRAFLKSLFRTSTLSDSLTETFVAFDELLVEYRHNALASKKKDFTAYCNSQRSLETGENANLELADCAFYSSLDPNLLSPHEDLEEPVVRKMEPHVTRGRVREACNETAIKLLEGRLNRDFSNCIIVYITPRLETREQNVLHDTISKAAPCGHYFGLRMNDDPPADDATEENAFAFYKAAADKLDIGLLIQSLEANRARQ